MILDVRSEADYNIFHILDAEHVPVAEISATTDELTAQPANTVVVVISNDEATAAEAGKSLVAESAPNMYILEGGINNWLDTFSTELEAGLCAEVKTASIEELRYEFMAA